MFSIQKFMCCSVFFCQILQCTISLDIQAYQEIQQRVNKQSLEIKNLKDLEKQTDDKINAIRNELYKAKKSDTSCIQNLKDCSGLILNLACIACVLAVIYPLWMLVQIIKAEYEKIVN